MDARVPDASGARKPSEAPEIKKPGQGPGFNQYCFIIG